LDKKTLLFTLVKLDTNHKISLFLYNLLFQTENCIKKVAPMVPRSITNILQTSAQKYPIVTLTGPRQSGKTTLVRKIFSDKPYVNLEKPDTRDFAINDPNRFLKQFPNGAIIDEFQNVPLLASYLQVIVDEKPTNNQFILTGSQQLEMMNNISQSLAGRTSILKLLPFSIKETTIGFNDFTIDELLFKGFYPRLHQNQIQPTHFYSDYLQTYVERDIRKILQIRNLSLFEKFIKLCAGRTGQLLNLNSLAADTGINHNTAREWLSILEASFIIHLVQPWFKNIGKRLVKSPKLYFIDTGFVSYLLGIENSKQLFSHPLRGQLFENLAIIETLKHYHNKGYRHPFYFYRDNNGVEIDLLIPKADKLLPIEIKSAETISSNMFRNLKLIKKTIPNLSTTAMLIYAGNEEYTRENIEIVNINNFTNLIDK